MCPLGPFEDFSGARAFQEAHLLGLCSREDESGGAPYFRQRSGIDSAHLLGLEGLFRDVSSFGP